MKKHTGQSVGSPDEPTMHKLHALLLDAEAKRRDGQLVEAEQICRALLEENPTYLGALQTFGLVALARKNYPQAMNCFLTAAAEAPFDWTNYSNLAEAWLGLEVPTMADLMLREALRLNPKNAAVHYMLGEVHVEAREYEAAMASYRTALSLEHEHELALLKLSDCCINFGFLDEARENLQKLYALRPDASAVVSLVLQLPGSIPDFNASLALDRCCQQNDETEAEFSTRVKFLKAAVEDRASHHDEAWKLIQDANASVFPQHVQPLKNLRRQRSRDLKNANQWQGEKPHKGLHADPRNSATPLFILGSSRAGKTTLETLIDRHTDIKRGFENKSVELAIQRTSQIAGLVTVRSLSLLPKSLLRSFAVQFESIISSPAGAARMFTNTNPGLIGGVPELAVALPNARFVFVSRNRNDLALRILMKHYKRSNHYAYNVKTVFEHVDWYDAMIDVLVSKLGGRALRLEYEEIVSNSEDVAESVFEFCDLPRGDVQFPTVGSDVGAANAYANMLKHQNG